ncbi:MAG: hypothetical protein ACLSCV_03240 [Acutalibacteraceae bacterium]
MLQPGEYRRLTAEEVNYCGKIQKCRNESRDGHDNRKTYRR